MRGLVLGFALAVATSAVAASPAVGELYATWKAAGAGEPDAARGGAAWTATTPGPDGQPRSCATCHTADVRKAGKHATTGEVIEPLSPAVTPARLTNVADVEKWLGRNCKWTYGRACTPQEKADFIAFIQR